MSLVGEYEIASAEEMYALGSRLANELEVGKSYCFIGELGVGKTTLIRGILDAKGVHEGVRSPTFNLLQEFDTDPPILHADLYRIDSLRGLGIEDYEATHALLIEWADRFDAFWGDDAVAIRIWFAGEGRLVSIGGLRSSL